MAIEAVTQEIPRLVDGPTGGRHGLQAHDAVFATAMARLEALTTSWQETLAGFGTDGGTGRHAAPDEPADDVAADDVAAEDVPAEAQTDEAAVAARAEAPRWRRSLAA